MARKTIKTGDIGVDVVDGIGSLSRSLSTLFIKGINEKNNRKIERTVNNDPRLKKRKIDPKRDIRDDLNLC